MKLYSTIPKKSIKSAKFDKSNQNKNKVRFIYNIIMHLLLVFEYNDASIFK